MSLPVASPSRRRALGWLGAAALAPGATGCGWFADQSIALSNHTWPGYEPLFFAAREKWLDPARVRILETTSATQSLEALAAGKVEAACLTLDEVLLSRARGVPLAVAAVLDFSAGADMLVAGPAIEQLADLRGMRLAFEPGAVGELMLGEILLAARLTRDDIRAVPLAHGEQLAAWEAGRMDACIAFEPLASRLLAQGGRNLFDSRRLPETILDVLAIRRDLVGARQGAAVRHAIDCHFRAVQHLQYNPQDAAYRMADHLKVAPAAVPGLFRGLVLPGAAYNRRLLTGVSPRMLATAGRVSGVMVRSRLLERPDDLRDLIRAESLP